MNIRIAAVLLMIILYFVLGAPLLAQEGYPAPVTPTSTPTATATAVAYPAPVTATPVPTGTSPTMTPDPTNIGLGGIGADASRNDIGSFGLFVVFAIVLLLAVCVFLVEFYISKKKEDPE